MVCHDQHSFPHLGITSGVTEQYLAVSAEFSLQVYIAFPGVAVDFDPVRGAGHLYHGLAHDLGSL